MGKKKSLVLYLGLVTLLALPGLFPFIRPELALANPDELKWSIVDSPGEEGEVVVSPSEINVFAIDSENEISYALDIPNEIIYKSIDGGITWEDDLAEALESEGAVLPAWDIAVAPDDPELVAVVTDSRQEVYISEDGGDSWIDMQLSSATGWDTSLLISDIAISPEYSGNIDIAVGTRNPDSSSNGDVWVIEESEFLAAWKAQELGLDVTSVQFSPDYEDDEAILVVASDTDKTYLCTGIRNTGANSTNWEETDPPKVEISEYSGDSPGESEIIFSDLALPSDYSGHQSGKRVVYAAYSSNTAADDVYRIEDTDVFRLDANRGDAVSIASIAFHGTCDGGKLLAGEVLAEADSATALIHICFEPEEVFPDWEEPEKPPTGGAISGNANAQVAWSSDGEMAYCGTGTNHVTDANEWKDVDVSIGHPWFGANFDESAFSQSENDGDTWNQLSLIDTTMAHLCDYALPTDTENDEAPYLLYLASVSNRFDSIWRSESETLEALGETWQRVLCFDGATDDIILRPTPEDSSEEAIFFAALDSDYARCSTDYGDTWKWVWECPHITDLAVVSDTLLYVLDDNLVNKGVWEDREYGDTWEWDIDVDTGLLSGYTISTSGEDFVFVGDEGDEGMVAYSVDGGVTFEQTLAVPESEPGEIWVIPDEDFDNNKFIYAAVSEGEIYRWTIEGSTSWRKLNPPRSGFCGLAQSGGALYGIYGPGIARTLIPHMVTITEDDWDELTVGLASGVSFRKGTLRAVRNETIDLWAIDEQNYDFSQSKGCLWIYSDSVALQSPWPTSPAIGELLLCDPCDCHARTFSFHWRKLPSTEKYELWVALDEKFESVLAKVDVTPVNLNDPACNSLEIPLRFTCGEIYYWKVRGSSSTEGESIHSRWSPPMHFTVKICSSIGSMHIAPVIEVPQSDSSDVPRSPAFSWTGFSHATKYEFILARDVDLTQVVVKEKVPISAYIYNGELDWGTTYFWQVKAIEPVPSEPSVVSSFTVVSAPEPTAPAATVVAPPTPLWVWFIIGILALLDIVIVVFCLVRR